MSNQKNEETAVKEKRLILNRKVIFTIPNILTYIRILSVPVYMTLIILSAKPSYPSWYAFVGLGVMVFAALTDVFDGMIARKYPGQGTYLGQLIDPVADKLMHTGALLALVIAAYLHWAFLALIVFRELCMVVVGSVIFNDVNVQANKLGKVASALLSVGIILSFFHSYISTLWGDYGFDWIIITIAIVLSYGAMINYARVSLPQFLAKKAAEKANKAELTEENTQENAQENSEEITKENNEEN